MKDEVHTNPLEDTITAVRDYVDLKSDEIRLNMAESLAKILSKLVYIVVMTVIGALAAGFAAVLASRWIKTLTGSEILGPLVMLCIFILIGLIMFFRKHSILQDSNLRMFVRILFEKDAADGETDDSESRTIEK